MTITQFIDTLQKLYREHGDIPVLDGQSYDFKPSLIRTGICDDWDHMLSDDRPGVGVAVLIGPRL